MKIYHKCTYEGYCPGQSWGSHCYTKDHPERLECPYIQEEHRSPIPKQEIDPRKPGVKDPDTPLPWWISLELVQELMKERQT